MKGRSGVTCPNHLVGTPGQTIKLRRGGKGGTSGSAPQGRKRTRGYYVCLKTFGQQARAVGWFNGERIRKDK